MVDPQPGVAGECVSEILPKGIDALGGVKLADRVTPPMLEEHSVGCSSFRPKQRIVALAIRGVDVQLGRHDVKIPDQRDRNIQLQEFGGVGVQACEPPQFVVEFRAGRWVSIG
jgi:hypothetical protein